ncbi:MAG: heme ABC transporter ATP-binding protein [Gammaproteobacteria bacterium]|nr:MAG: heme ABC transporter ATP-binding protein [Gammaproteobacteria bacterium]
MGCSRELIAAVSILQLRHVSAAPWGPALLDDINISLEPGAILGLAGPNGAGKSSLLRLIAGDINSNGGELTLAGRPLSHWTPQQRALRLAFLPQMSLLSFPYTVEEVVLLGRTPHASGNETDRVILEQVLELTDTLDLRHRLYTQLSGGERQRTQLARVFTQIWGEDSLAGKLLLLDEPTSALDLAHQQQILSAVQLLARRGCAVVLAIHDLNLAASIADTVLVLDCGRQVALGSPQQVFTQSLFKEVFQVDVIVSSHPQQGFPLIIPQRSNL